MIHAQDNDTELERRLDASARTLRRYLEERLTQVLRALSKHVQSDDQPAFREALKALQRLFGLRRALAFLASSLRRIDTSPQYLVSGRLLREAFRVLTKTQMECLAYVTGPCNGTNTYALAELVEVELADARPAYANPEAESQMDVLERLSEDGLALLATFHSHPGRGAGATHPSGTDLSTQEQLETLGYPAIGAIFSRDGFVRFYSNRRPFKVAVSGTATEQLTNQLYRITGLGINPGSEEGSHAQ